MKKKSSSCMMAAGGNLKKILHKGLQKGSGSVVEWEAARRKLFGRKNVEGFDEVSLSIDGIHLNIPSIEVPKGGIIYV